MKQLAAQALAYQYKLQLETAKTVINNNTATLNMVDQALTDISNATDKLKLLNDIAKSSLKEVESQEENKTKNNNK